MTDEKFICDSYFLKAETKHEHETSIQSTYLAQPVAEMCPAFSWAPKCSFQCQIYKAKGMHLQKLITF